MDNEKKIKLNLRISQLKEFNYLKFNNVVVENSFNSKTYWLREENPDEEYTLEEFPVKDGARSIIMMHQTLTFYFTSNYYKVIGESNDGKTLV